MVYLSYICFFLFIHHSCHSYVLLTASVDDVHAIADQVAKSPVVTQIKDIWQQAYKTFVQHYAQGKRSKSQGRQKTATYNQYAEARPLPDVRFPKGFAHAPVLRSVQSPGSPNVNQQLQEPEDVAKEDLEPAEARPLPDVRVPKGFAYAPVLRSVQSSGSPNVNQQLQEPEDVAKEDLKPVKNQRRFESSPAQLTSYQEDLVSQEVMAQRRQAANALVDLGRNASMYLRSLQKILETM